MTGFLAEDPRIASTPIVDAGLASVRKISEGTYATISDTSKGMTTMCNGGFLVGKDAALLIEGFVTANGAAFQLETLRKVTLVPAAGAVDSHYHFDHSCGNSYYGSNNIPLWGHTAVAKRITEEYLPMQTADKAMILAPYEKRVQDANSEVAKQHAQACVTTLAGVVDIIKKTTLTPPNRALVPATLPLSVDLGGFQVVIETFAGHSGTDLVVKVPEKKSYTPVIYSSTERSPPLSMRNRRFPGGEIRSRRLLRLIRTRFLCRGTGSSADRKVSRWRGASLTISPNRQKKCIKRACRFQRPLIVTWCRRNSSPWRCGRGTSVSQPQ
jgi:glyoxylase-like metal-dependent hydrolase (beta-lactamase superfamily II)